MAASASNATSVEYWILGGTYGFSGHLIGTATSTPYGWAATWDTTTVPNGSYVLVSEAFNAGGSAYSAGVTITVSNPLTAIPPPMFDDEFQGSTLSSAWTAVADPGDASNQEQECFSPQNVTVTGGMLEEEAEVGSIAKCYCPPAPASTKPCGYISGAVQWTSLSFTYGTVSVRAKLSGGKGTWPAIWLLGTKCQSPTWLENNCAWPAPGSNEIDIAEILQSNLTKVNQQVHTENSSGASESPGCTASTSDVSQNWHTYSLIWAPGSLTWEIDGVPTCKITSYVPSTPMFMIINQRWVVQVAVPFKTPRCPRPQRSTGSRSLKARRGFDRALHAAATVSFLLPCRRRGVSGTAASSALGRGGRASCRLRQFEGDEAGEARSALLHLEVPGEGSVPDSGGF